MTTTTTAETIGREQGMSGAPDIGAVGGSQYAKDDLRHPERLALRLRDMAASRRRYSTTARSGRRRGWEERAQWADAEAIQFDEAARLIQAMIEPAAAAADPAKGGR